MEDKDVKWLLLTTAIIWIATSAAICVSIYYTKSAIGLWALILLPTPSLKSKK